MAATRFFWGLTLAGYFATMAMLTAWYGWLAPPRVLSPALVVTLLVVPLFAPLRGLLHARPYTVAWSLFLSLPYFAHGVIEAYSTPAARPWALVEIVATLCWMTAGTLFIRARRAAR